MGRSNWPIFKSFLPIAHFFFYHRLLDIDSPYDNRLTVLRMNETVQVYMAHHVAYQCLCQFLDKLRFRSDDDNLLLLIGSHRHTQQEGNRNQSMNIPLQSLSGSYASNLCHLYFCSHPQSPLHRFVCVFLQGKIQA